MNLTFGWGYFKEISRYKTNSSKSELVMKKLQLGLQSLMDTPDSRNTHNMNKLKASGTRSKY